MKRALEMFNVEKMQQKYVCVCVCVCVYVPMPIHCTITRFGLHARWTNGVECGLFFRITQLLDRQHYVWDEYLYSVSYCRKLKLS